MAKHFIGNVKGERGPEGPQGPAYTLTDADKSGIAAEVKTSVCSYGTEDLAAGSSALETGKLHFVYE